MMVGLLSLRVQGMDGGRVLAHALCLGVGGGGGFSSAARIVRKTVLFPSGYWIPAPPCLKLFPLSPDHHPPQPSQLTINPFYKFKSDLVPPQFKNLSSPHGSWLLPLNSFFPSPPHSLGTNLPASLPPDAGCSPPGLWHGWLHPTLHHRYLQTRHLQPLHLKGHPLVILRWSHPQPLSQDEIIG